MIFILKKYFKTMILNFGCILITYLALKNTEA